MHSQGTQVQVWHKAIEQSYAQGITDEFLQPIVIQSQAGTPKACLQQGDVVLCFNFRTDRSRQITQALTQAARPQWGMHPLKLYYLTMTVHTMTVYGDRFRGVKPLFVQDVLSNTLGEVLSKHKKGNSGLVKQKNIRMSRTFFLEDERIPFPGEERMLCPSPQVAPML